MSLLKKIKGMLGMGDDASGDGDRETSVTVEREPPADDDAEPAAAGTDAAASTGSLVEESEDPEEAAEPAEAVDAVGDGAVDPETVGDEEADADEADEEPDADDVAEEPDETGEPAEEPDEVTGEDDEAEEDAGGEDEEDGTDGEPVDSLRGIGPAYAERLAEVGIHTVADLAEADPTEVAEGASVGEKRATTWIDRAKEF